MTHTLFFVALGGALGASARYLTGVATIRLFGPGFPWGTVAVNLIGSFLMGVLVVVLAHSGNSRAAPFLMTGLLGGFTTFSAFSLDAVSLWQRGDVLAAGGYIAGSVTLGIAGLLLGLATARGLYS